GRIWLEVRDSGAGIAPEDRARIFDEFQRANAEGAEPGMGLGLAIVRRACAKLGHPLELRSEIGRGTVFRVGLPRIEALPAAPSRDAPGPGRGGLRGSVAILVENDPAMQRAYAL